MNVKYIEGYFDRFFVVGIDFRNLIKIKDRRIIVCLFLWNYLFFWFGFVIGYFVHYLFTARQRNYAYQKG